MYSPLVSSVTHFCNNDTYEQKNKTRFIKGGGESSTMVRMYVCNKDIRCNLFFRALPKHSLGQGKDINIQNNILRPMYSPLVSSVTHFCNNDTYEQKNKTWGGESSTMVRMYVCNKDIRCNLFFRALPQHQSGARKTDYKTLQNCLELRL